MWYDELPEDRSWTCLWSEYVRCRCGGIRKKRSACQACHAPEPDLSPMRYILENGEEIEIAQAQMGGEGRYEDYEFLALIEREWKRPVTLHKGHFTSGMSERGTVLLLFWTYFETRMHRLVEIGLQTLPQNVQKDLRSRYDSVTALMKTLYEILYGVKYLDDLKAVEAEHIGGHIARIQDARNRFIHGDPKAISDELAEAVVRNLKDEHEAWIAVFNRRISLKNGRNQ